VISKKICFFGFQFFVFAILIVKVCAALEPSQFPTLQVGSYPFLMGRVGIPQDEFTQKLIPGFLERARANQAIVADLYDQRKLLEEFPHWRKILEAHPGYWSELIGRLGDRHFARLYGPDIWRIKGTHQYVVGEENGANVGGLDHLTRGAALLRERSGQFGDAPYDSDIYVRLLNQLRTLAQQFYGRSENLTIVIADEASLARNPIDVGGGQMVTPPFPVGADLIDFIRHSVSHAGGEWVSLVDDRGRIFVEDGILYLRDKLGSGRKKIDVFWSLADIESMDPSHQKQVERNTRAHKPNLNETSRLIGIPGIVSAWIETPFLWVNNPASTITQTKLWPKMIDELIQKRTGRSPLLPSQETLVFFDKDGRLNESVFEGLRANPRKFVYKLAVGDGGEQVWLGSDFGTDEASREFLNGMFLSWARANPFSVLAQPEVELDRLRLPDGTDRVFDIRQIGLISGHGETFKATLARSMMMRIAGKNFKKVNCRNGGAVATGVPADVRNPGLLPPLPPIGVNQVNIPHEISEAELSKLKEDAADRALIEAYLIRDLMFNRERLFRDIPGLRSVVENSIYYRLDRFEGRSRRFPIRFYSGPDYMHRADGQYAALEHNVTNLGGLFRMWRQQIPGVKEEMKRWFDEVRASHGGVDPVMVYFLEATNLGIPWELVRQEFKRDFGFEIASASEIQAGRLKVEGDFQFYQNDAGERKRVDGFFLHMEPDFIDPEIATDDELLTIMTPDELRERRRHSNPGTSRVIKAGNLMAFNEPGFDIVCTKALLPFMPLLRRYYLHKDEVLPTQPSRSFVDDHGNLNEAILAQVRAEPLAYIIKNGEITGGAGGVFILRRMSEHERAALYKAVERNPSHFVLQEYAPSGRNFYNDHAEVRVFTLVEVAPDPDAVPRVVGQIPLPYIRANQGDNQANLLPTDAARASGVTEGFVMPVRIRCQAGLAALAAAEI
jgi:uncharacterized circularly permuted ATP-grasp superfamily protein